MSIHDPGSAKAAATSCAVSHVVRSSPRRGVAYLPRADASGEPAPSGVASGRYVSCTLLRPGVNRLRSVYCDVPRVGLRQWASISEEAAATHEAGVVASIP